MKNQVMNRKGFLKTLGRAGICGCAAASGLRAALALTPGQAGPGDKTPERALKRMRFADQWTKRFFDIVDQTLDPETRKKLMMANGRTCLSDWIRESKKEIKQVDFDKWAEGVSKAGKPDGPKIEGNVIHYQYGGSAETGQASPEGICLCPMVESKPAGLSPTYCLCSVGYVKEMHELLFGRKVDVELLDSVLMGGKRCRFKITVKPAD